MNSANKKALLKLSKPRAVIFDWDNTLVNTWSLIHLAINHTMENMGKQQWSEEETKDRVRNSMRESFPAIFGDDWQKAGKIYQDRYHSFNLEKLKFLPSALDLIDKLHQNKVLLIVISNKFGATLRKEAKHLGIDSKFFSIIGSMDATADKPSKEPVELALLASAINPNLDHIWFIGDSIVDLECAYNSNCYPIIYGDGATIDQEILLQGKNQEGAIAMIDDYQELIKIIDDLFK